MKSGSLNPKTIQMIRKFLLLAGVLGVLHLYPHNGKKEMYVSNGFEKNHVEQSGILPSVCTLQQLPWKTIEPWALVQFQGSSGNDNVPTSTLKVLHPKR